MNEIVLDIQKMPADYAFCFNQQCPLHEHCMHFVVGQQAPCIRLFGPAVYPWALHDGQCEMYRESVPVQMAWGFARLYDHLPHHVIASARRSVQLYFSGGVGPYYRYHHGERKLSPKQQQEIIAIVMSCGSTQIPRFDHYELTYDFT